MINEKEKIANITYAELFDWYNQMFKVLNGKSYHDFLKEECGIDLTFNGESGISVIVKDDKKYLVSKLKYGF